MARVRQASPELTASRQFARKLAIRALMMIPVAATARICAVRTMLKVSCAEDTRESSGYCAGRCCGDGRSDGDGPGRECECYQ
jgi:hypothetical protein